MPPRRSGLGDSAVPPQPAHPALGGAATPDTLLRRAAGRSPPSAAARTPHRRDGREHLTGLCCCIDIDLLLVGDTRRAPRRRESVMRHFFTAPLAPARLTAGMMHPAAKALLVALTRPAHTLTPRLTGAGRRAIPLAVVTAPAHPRLLMTPGTVPHAVADDVDRTTSSPQRLDAAGQSRHCLWRDTRTCRSLRRLPEGSRRQSSGLHLLRSALVLSRRRPQENSRHRHSRHAPTKKRKEMNQIHEAHGSEMR